MPLRRDGRWRKRWRKRLGKRLGKWKLSFRRTRTHSTSPDAAYRCKAALLERVQAAAKRGELVLLYGDEHTFYRQP